MPGSVSKKITSKSPWRKYQKKSKTQSKVRLGVIVLAALVLLILGGRLLGLLWNLSQPFSPDTPAASKKLFDWDGDRVVNLVLKSDKVYVASFNPVDKSLVILAVPDETYLNLPYGFGKWPIRSVYDLGQAEKPPMGAKLLKETISYSFGIPVDGYMIFSESQTKKQNIFSFSALTSGKTDLSALELLKLWWGARNVRFDKIKDVDLGQSEIVSSSLLADGSSSLNIDPIKLDQYLQEMFEDSKFKTEGLNIGIFNATEHPGLAEKASRLITNTGGRVIFTANSATKLPKSMVLAKPSYTAKRLSELFAPDCINNTSKCTLTEGNFDSSRAEINIILGEDFFLRYNSK